MFNIQENCAILYIHQFLSCLIPNITYPIDSCSILYNSYASNFNFYFIRPLSYHILPFYPAQQTQLIFIQNGYSKQVKQNRSMVKLSFIRLFTICTTKIHLVFSRIRELHAGPTPQERLCFIAQKKSVWPLLLYPHRLLNNLSAHPFLHLFIFVSK